MSRQRRAAGEGGISPVRNKDGKIIAYEGSIEVKDHLGSKRRRKKVRGKTKTEVSQKLRELRTEQEQGRNLGTPQQTVAQYLAHWLNDVVRIRNSPKTYSSYEMEIRNHIVPFVGNIRLDVLNQTHIEKMRNILQETPHAKHPERMLSARQVEYAVSVLSRAMNRAIKEKLITYNPAALVEVQKSVPKRTALTMLQAQRFLAALEGHRMEAFYAALILTGIRKGEALALIWSDIDLAARQITISKTAQRIHGFGRHVGRPKTRKDRVIAMPGVLVTLLEQHKVRQEADGAYGEHRLVFPSTRGTIIEAPNLRRQFLTLLEKAELPANVTIHSLRHTCATLLLDAGESAVNVAAQLGHAQVTTTLNIYAHKVQASQARGVDQLGKKLKGEEE